VISLFVSWVCPNGAYALSELRELYRGTKAQAMGGASVAMVEDEQAIFLNPAGLAGVPRYSINYAVVDAEASGDTIASISDTSIFNNMSVGTLNRLMGKDTYARVQVTPSIVMPTFGLAVLADVQGAVLAKNMFLPQINIGYQNTYGIQFGYGASLGSLGGRSRYKGRGSGGGTKSELRVGVAGKIMWRRGGYHLLSFSQLININQDTMKALTGDYGIGYGVDLGTQYIVNVNDRLRVSVGATFDNIGDMAFSSIADPQAQTFNLGLGLKYTFSKAAVRLAYDYRSIFADADWRKKTHIGLGVDIPLFSVFLGLNQMKYSFGATFDIWLVQVTAVEYFEEMGATLGDDSERRYLLQVSLKF
jgi:long-subunit fatty acid transport protein